MLKPAEMRELRIVCLEEHADAVIKRIDALGSVHLTDIKEFLEEWEGLIEPSKAGATLMQTAELLARIDSLVALLRARTAEGARAGAKKSLREMLFKAPGAEEEQVAARVAARVAERVKERGEERRLAEVEAEFGGLEAAVTELAGERERLRAELSDAEELLGVQKILANFGVNLEFVSGEKNFISVLAGWLPSRNLDALGSSLEAEVGVEQFVASSRAEGEQSFALVVVLKKDRAEAERALARLDFERWQQPLPLPLPLEAEVEAEIKRLERELRENEGKIEALRREKFEDLLEMQELVQIEESKAKVKVLFGRSERVRVLEGWTPKEEVEKVVAGVTEETGGFSVVEVREPAREDVRVPSLLKNPRILKPFEGVVKMYGHPLYKDIDPTLLTALIFPILFGLMFPDIGHGALLLLLGLALVFAFKGLGEEARGAGVIVSLCGACSVVAGALFGEFFGFSEYATHLVEGSVGLQIPHSLHWFVNEPLWFEPIPKVEFMFVVTMLIGVIHMGLGLSLNVVNNFSKKTTLQKLTGLVQIWCLFGALYFLLLLFGFFFDELKTGNTPLLLQNATLFVLLPILLLFVFKVVSELRHDDSGGEGEGEGEGEREGEGKRESRAKRGAKRGGMDYFIILIDGVIDALLENFFRFLANTVSYGRILALALCHAALIEVFILLSFMCLRVNVGVAAVVFLLGTAVVIVLEAIMAGIHTIRLHFYEWFTKFYEGGGVEFSPFKLRRTKTRTTS